jgi:hypothetical protein
MPYYTIAHARKARADKSSQNWPNSFSSMRHGKKKHLERVDCSIIKLINDFGQCYVFEFVSDFLFNFV